MPTAPTPSRRTEPPPYHGERLRNFRCPDDLWVGAIDLAKAEGIDGGVSALLRDALEAYMRQPGQRRTAGNRFRYLR